MDIEAKKCAVLAYLKERGWHITFAESCTGGLLASSLVDLPSASSVLNESYVTYANESKTALCGVLPETLSAHGAVSEQTAGEMAAGAARRAHAEIAVSVSGIAGPEGGTAKKPVGTVCFGFSLPSGVQTTTAHFGNLGRGAVREASVSFAWQELYRLLNIEG